MPQLVLIRLRYLFNSTAMLFLITVVFGGACTASENMSLPGLLSPWEDRQTEQRGFSSCVLMLKVVGLDPPSGILRIAVYNSKKNYEAKRYPARSADVEISSSNSTIIFDDLKPGKYAIMMYHDTNRNNQFDRFMGFPEEQYGFSNNILPGFGPPDFDQVNFEVAAGNLTFIKIIAR